MKSTLNFLTKSGLFISVLMLTAAAHAASFTATASGNWGDGASWTGGIAPSFNVTGDTITIPSGIDITLNNNVTIDGALSLIAVEGTLSAVDNTTLTISGGVIAGGGTIDVSTINLEPGLNFSFTGTVSAENLTTSVASWQTTGTVNVDENLTLQAGQLHFLSGGTFNLDNEAKITRVGGEITSNDGTMNFPNDYSVEYKNTGALNTGLEIDHSGLQDVLINTGGTGVVTLNSDLTLRGTLYLNSGTLDLGNYDLLIEGNIADGGTGVIASSDTSDVKIIGTSAISGSLRFSATANEIRDFTLDIGNNHAELEGSLEVTGNFKLTSGILNLNDADLTITGNVGDGDGTLSSTETSSITINTVTPPSGDLEFENGGNTVNNFTLNITNGGALELSSDMNVAGTLTLTKGRLDADNQVITINDGGDISGGNAESYIVTGNDGRLSMDLDMGILPTTYPVGTETRYLPAGVTLALLSTAGRVDVGVMPNVYSEGTTGIDFSNNQSIVDATWMVSSEIADDDLDMSLRLSWPVESEVNGFARNACFIAHYDGSWDSPAAGIATGTAAMYSISRSNITELSPFAVFDENTSTSVKDVLAEAGIRVYPNPSTSDQLYIDNNRGTALNMDIINIHGETVGSYKLDANSNTVPVNELAQGCYTIRLYNGNFNVSSRFIKL